MSFACDPPCGRTFKTAAARDQHKVDAPKHTKHPDRAQPVAPDTMAAPAPPPPVSFDNASLSRSFNTALVLFAEPKGKGKQKEDPFPCVSCNIAFVSQEALDGHFKRSPQHQWVQPACVPCNKTFATQALLEAHLASALAHRAHACVPCGRVFDSGPALNAHVKDSPAHRTAFACDSCSRAFASQPALDAHIKDTPAHNRTIKCTSCDRMFASQSALSDHMKDAPAHKKKITCLPCSTSFASQSALEDHLRDSPAHNKVMCLPCNKEFASAAALEAHVDNSPKHKAPQAIEFPCPSCDSSFASQDALDMHLTSPKHAPAPALTKRDSSDSWESLDISRLIETLGSSVAAELSPPDTPDTPVAEVTEVSEVTEVAQVAPPAPDTPLDLFFRLFPGFHYNHKASPEESFRQLKRFSHWDKNSRPEKTAWQKYQDALVKEVELWFGDTSDIHAWHHLCEAVGVRDPPPTITECKKVSQRLPFVPSTLALLSSFCFYTICALFSYRVLPLGYTLLRDVSDLASLCLVTNFHFLVLLLWLSAWAGTLHICFPSRS